jgi:hypothetical protein
MDVDMASIKVLKGMWVIILNKIDMPLQNLPNVTTTCIYFHNLYTIHENSFFKEWAKEIIHVCQVELMVNNMLTFNFVAKCKTKVCSITLRKTKGLSN